MADPRWKGRSLPLLLILTALLGGSCGLLRPSGRLLVLTDPATQVLMEHGGLREGVLEQLAARRGMTLQVVSAPAPREAEPLLRGIARQSPPRQVLLLTPFPVDAEGLGAEFPRTVFIRLAAAATEQRLPPNWIVVRFDRREAFRRAGGLVAGLLSGAAEGKAAVVLGDPGPRTLEDAAAFGEGFARVLDPSRLVERELPARTVGGEGGLQDDPRGIRPLLEGLHREGVRFFLLKAYAANEAGLETVARLGAAAVVEDWQASRVRPEAVLLSVEPDLRGALERALAAAADLAAAGPASETGNGAPDVAGPVRLVRGGALPAESLPVNGGAGR